MKLNSNPSQDRRAWLTNKKIICVVLLLLVAGYIAVRPSLQQWMGFELPNPISDNAGQIQNEDSPATEKRQTSKSDNGQFRLEQLPGGAMRTPAGLVYRKSAREHRIDHVLRHSKDMPDRPIHGVFEGDRNAILRVIDDAYRLIKADSKLVSSEKDGNRIEHRVNMQRRIGYVGGQAGRRKNHPPCNYLKIVLQQNNVITAYPVDR